MTAFDVSKGFLFKIFINLLKHFFFVVYECGLLEWYQFCLKKTLNIILTWAISLIVKNFKIDFDIGSCSFWSWLQTIHRNMLVGMAIHWNQAENFKWNPKGYPSSNWEGLDLAQKWWWSQRNDPWKMQSIDRQGM